MEDILLSKSKLLQDILEDDDGNAQKDQEEVYNFTLPTPNLNATFGPKEHDDSIVKN